MINAKILYYTLLQDARLSALVGEKVFDAYPETVENFPCVIYLDDNQRDAEFADNLPMASNLEVAIHIYTKAIDGYATTSDIGLVVAQIMREHYFTCVQNRELSDSVDDVRHRVLIFTKAVLS